MELLENAQPGHLPRAGPARRQQELQGVEPVTRHQRTQVGIAALLFLVWLWAYILHSKVEIVVKPAQACGEGKLRSCAEWLSTRFSTKVAQMFTSLDRLSLAGREDYVGWYMWKQMLVIIRNGQQGPGICVKAARLCVRWWWQELLHGLSISSTGMLALKC